MVNALDLPNLRELITVNEIKPSLLRSLKYRYFEKLSSASTSHAFWNRIKKLHNKFFCIPTLVHNDTYNVASSPHSKLEMLNKYLYSCLDKSCPPMSVHPPSFSPFLVVKTLNARPKNYFIFFPVCHLTLLQVWIKFQLQC